jgi:hypothetical protein
VVPAYRAPRPIVIDTADIDVSTPRKRTDRISRDRDDIQQGTIKRGRTVVRLHTKRLKDNPGLHQNRRKTPGEKLVEKFLIRDKVSEEVKGRKLEAEADRLKHAYRGSASLEAENGHSIASGRVSGLIGSDEPEEILTKKPVTGEGGHDVVNVTQSEAFDILLSQTENGTVIVATTSESVPGPEHSPSQEKSDTANKIPKKGDKGSTIKRSEIVQTPVEKSLLQRRNTMKRLRRNSRDLEIIPLDVSDHECSMPSTHAGPLPISASSVSSTLTASTISTPIESTPSTTITPTLELLSDTEEVIKSAVTKPKCSNRDACPFKTKVSDGRSERNISKKVSVDVSVENADDIFKKIPFRFVVDEIKIEETPKSPKSPKLVRYEVTVDEIADTEPPFQTQMSSVINDVSSTLENMYQVDDAHFSSGNTNNEQAESKGTVTAALNMTTIQSLSDTCSKLDIEGGSKVADQNKEFIVPKCEAMTFPVEQIQNMKDTLNDSVTIDKKGIDRHKLDHKDTTEKGICNKLSLDSSSVSSSQRSEIILPVEQKNPQSSIPAWKKALIAKSQASNVKNSENVVNLEHKRKEINLNSKTQIPNNNSVLSSTNTSGKNALKTLTELPSKQGGPLREETMSPSFLSTKICSDISEPKSKDQQQVGKSKPEDADIICGKYTPGELELQSDISEVGAKVKVKETKNKGTEEQKSEEAEQKVNSFEKAATENTKCAPADLHVNKRKLVENKLKPGQPLPAEKVKTARTKLEDVKSKFTEKTPIGKTKPTEAKMEESKSKFAHTEMMKLSERKIKGNKFNALPSSPVETPPKLNVTECKRNSSTSANSETAETEPLRSKLTYVETSPVEEGPKTTKSSITIPTSSIGPLVGEIVETDVKPVDNETNSVRKSVEMIRCTETEVPSTAPDSVEEVKGAESKTVQVSDSKTAEAKSQFVETSETDKSESVETDSKLGKPLSLENKTKIVETKPPEKKVTPMKAKVLGQPKFSGTPAVEEEMPCDASTVPEVRAEPLLVEEEDETDDDGEDVTLASFSSSEDSGFDSIPTSVPGSPACYKKGPDSKSIHPIFKHKTASTIFVFNHGEYYLARLSLHTVPLISKCHPQITIEYFSLSANISVG